MPFYAVRITGWEDAEAEAQEVRAAFRGKDADFTGTRSYFYVQNRMKLEMFERTVRGMVNPKNDVAISKISKVEYNWEAHLRTRG